MGTRATTTVHGDGKPILSFYRQFDGYPDGHGQDIADFLTGKTVVNGISGDEANIVNGPGDLAVRLLVSIKDRMGGVDRAGNLYAIPHDQAGSEDFHYDVFVTSQEGWGDEAVDGEIFVEVLSYGTLIAGGTPDEFVSSAMAAAGIAAGE